EELSLLAKMDQAMAHRGPDHSGSLKEVTDGVSIGLVNRRLKILDLSAAGNQPMQSADGRSCVIYNGELYNHPELKRELTALGHAYVSRTDTGTVLHAYEQYGVDAFPRFNGMFAVAAYDRERHSLLLARDRMGIKPLYYSW